MINKFKVLEEFQFDNSRSNVSKWKLLVGIIIIVVILFAAWFIFKNQSKTLILYQESQDYKFLNNINYKTDNDNDGLSDYEELAWRTDPSKSDTDGDGYSDYNEINKGYNPLGEGRLLINSQKQAEETLNKDYDDMSDIGKTRIYTDYMNHYSVKLESGWRYANYSGGISYFELQYENITIKMSITNNTSIMDNPVNQKKVLSVYDKIASFKKAISLSGYNGYKYTISQDLEPHDGSNLYVAIKTENKTSYYKTRYIAIDFGYGSKFNMKENSDFINELEEKIVKSFKIIDFSEALKNYYVNKDEASITYCPKLLSIHQRDRCYSDLAEVKNDNQFCELVQAYKAKDECLEKLSKVKNF